MIRCPDCDYRLENVIEQNEAPPLVPDHGLVMYACRRCQLTLTKGDVDAMPRVRLEEYQHGPECRSCEQPMVWSEEFDGWVCEDSEMAHVSAFPCPLCQKGTRDLGSHAEGCPNGPDVKIGCMGCGEYIPLREMAAHVMEAHDIDLGQDEIEQSFVQIRERLDTPMGRAAAFLNVDMDDVWKAIGQRAIRGEWPDSFDVGAGLLLAMSAWVEVVDDRNSNADAAEKLGEIANEAGATLARIRNDVTDTRAEIERHGYVIGSKNDDVAQLLAQHFQRLELLLQQDVTVESEDDQ